MHAASHTIEATKSIESAIAVMDHLGRTYLYVVEEGKLLGIVRLNELRREILHGTDPKSALSRYAGKNYVTLNVKELADQGIVESRSAEADLLDLGHIPVVGDAAALVDMVEVQSRESRAQHSRRPPTTNVRNVLIIGGAGYLGSVLTEELLHYHYKVRVFDSLIYGKAGIERFIGSPQFELIVGDIRNIEQILGAIDGMDAVVLLAAIVGDPASSARPRQTIETNLLATQAVALACKSQHVNRLIFASTCSVYGRSDTVPDEESELNPISLYARLKISAEESIRAMANGHFSPTILRLSTLYGYSPRMRFDLVVNTMTMKAYVDRKITIFGGEQWRPLLHVRDAGRAFRSVLEAPIDTVSNQVFNVGSSAQNYQVKAIGDIVAGSIDGVRVLVEHNTIDDRDYRVSFAKIESALGFRTQETVRNAVRDIYQKLKNGTIRNPNAKVFYNHYFDSTEEQ